MIYQVNWISKDKDNVTTTTDVTKYVTVGFSNVNKLGEEMDIGSIELKNTDRDTPYPIWDVIQVNIYNDVTEEYDEVISMRIAGDKISLASKNPKKYTHNITLVEHTKLLELFVINGKTFTNPTDGSDGYSIADVVETLFRVTPLEIMTLIKIALSVNSTITVSDEYSTQENETISLSITSPITTTDTYTSYENDSISISVDSLVSVSDEYSEYLNEDGSVSVVSNIDVSDSVINQVNLILLVSVESVIGVNDNIINQVNVDSNFSITSNVSVDDTIILQENFYTSNSITSSISIDDSIYINRAVEWVEGGTSVTSDQTCDEERDVDNVKKETIGECSFDEDGTTYTSINDLTTSIPTCEQDATFTLCIGTEPNFTCQDYIGVDTREDIYYTCVVKT